MLKKIIIGIVVVLGALAAVIATRPSTFHIERSADAAAPADVVFAMITDFHQWAEWSPWEKMDATMKKTYSGAPSGPGSVYEWTGNDKVGQGRMTILAVKPNEQVSIKLEFIKPWTATNQVAFDLKPASDKTKVSWSMDGQHDFMGKAFSMFMDMDKMVGGDFEKGLAKLSEVSATEAKKRQEEAARAAAAAQAAAAPADVAPAGKH
jgi:uncharacterized protein YndB with AHSA1/START domain